MKDKKIIAGNNLIAVFLGANVLSVTKRRTGNLYIYDKAGNYNSYHSDWNELIPVLEKIESLGYHTRICFDDFGTWMQIHYGLSVADTSETKALNQHGTKIENTFNSIVEFIKWYNKKK
jgi:hypothetical protein